MTDIQRRIDRMIAEQLAVARDEEILAAVFASSSDPRLQRRSVRLLESAERKRSMARQALGLTEETPL